MSKAQKLLDETQEQAPPAANTKPDERLSRAHGIVLLALDDWLGRHSKGIKVEGPGNTVTFTTPDGIKVTATVTVE